MPKELSWPPAPAAAPAQALQLVNAISVSEIVFLQISIALSLLAFAALLIVLIFQLGKCAFICVT